MSTSSADKAILGRLTALVERRIRRRFDLDAAAFVDRIAAIGHRHDIVDETLVSFASRLSLEDLYLATACAAGDNAAWTECIEKYRDFIHGFARRTLPEPAAIDVATDVIEGLWERKRIATYEGRSTLRTWLGTLVAHAAINAVKSPKQAAEQVRRHDYTADVESELETAERASVLARLLAESIEQQPPDHQLLLLLYYEQGLSLEEIGSTMHVSKAAVSRRLKRIREALFDAIDARARKQVGTPAPALADGLTWSKVDLDLREACRVAVERRATKLV